MNIKQVLSNPITKALLESIEDLNSSLESYPNGETTLEQMLVDTKTELSQFGFDF